MFFQEAYPILNICFPGMFCFHGLRGLENLWNTPNALSLVPGVMCCMTRADPNRQNLNKDTKNYRVWHSRWDSTTSVIQKMTHRMCVIPQIIFITRCDTPHKSFFLIFLAWFVRLNQNLSVILEFMRKYVQERLVYEKVQKFRLSHQKCDRGDNTVGWGDTEQ